MSEEEIYVLPDGDTVVFSPDAHKYALAEYGSLEPHFGSHKRAMSLIYDLQRDNLLTVTENNGRFFVKENGKIPIEFTNRMTTIGDLEESILANLPTKKPENDGFLTSSRFRILTLTKALEISGFIVYN